MAGAVSNMSHIASLLPRSSGKYYAELKLASYILLSAPGHYQVGMTTELPIAHGSGGLTSDDGGVAWNGAGRIEQSGSYIHTLGDSPALIADDVICVAAHLGAGGGKVWMARNNSAWVGGGDPDAGTTPTATIATSGDWYLAMCAGYNVSFGPTLEPFVWRVALRTREDQFTRTVRPSTFVQWA